jgi:hypothetical protein
MMPNAEFDAVKERILAEFTAQGFGKTLSFKEAMDLRAYARDRTNLHSDELTLEQSIWKVLYEAMTETCRKAAPEEMGKIERLEERRDDLDALIEMMRAKLPAGHHDYGMKVWRASVIIGILVGWIRSPDLQTILLYGLIFWAAGIFVCIFVIDSAEVQSKLAIFIYHKLRMERLATWLYSRALRTFGG